jgi:septum formation protein
MSEVSLVLASNSPRRKELLGLFGLDFSVRPADIDETEKPDEDPKAYVRRLALSKARKMSGFAGFKEVVLAADTTVTDGRAILGKPANETEARLMLRKLRGRVHFVHTAVVLLAPAGGLIEQELCTSRVRLRAFTDEEIDAYIKTGDPLDKAGAYAIQNEEFMPVDQFKGCYASVMGLPLCHVERSLRRMGFGERKSLPFSCQNKLSYNCPVFQRILGGEDVG